MCFVLSALSASEPTATIPSIDLEPMAEHLSLDRPVDLDIAAPAIGLAYILEQHRGSVRVIEWPSGGGDTIALDLGASIDLGQGNEEGLLALCLAPDFTTSRTLYLYYTTAKPQRRGRVMRYRATADYRHIDPASADLVLEVDQPYGNHNGADLKFGPDGMLYISLGDGGKRDDPHGHSQNLSTLLGAILRIDVSTTPYRIPADNPFVTTPDARGEIWAYGLRNPWRLTFDRASGELWTGDVGQNAWEEIDIIERGGNYGWNAYEGSRIFVRKPATLSPPPDAIGPVFEYGHDEHGGFSVTGGVVYRGAAYPTLNGVYLLGDFASGRLWGLRRSNQHTHSRVIHHQAHTICHFSEDHAGEVYAVFLNGRIMRVTCP
jgi:glucose/arabinose dehydrogenase